MTDYVCDYVNVYACDDFTESTSLTDALITYKSQTI